MTTRNRTPLFLQYRLSYGHGDSSHLSRAQTLVSDAAERAGLMANAADMDGADGTATVIEMSVLPPQWVDLMEEINEDMDSIRSKVSELDELHRRQLLPGLDEGVRYERDIERKQAEITSSFRHCQQKIKRIGSSTGRGGGPDAAAADEDERLGRNVRTALATRLQEMSSAFRRKQTGFLQKLKQREARTKGLLFESTLESGEGDAASSAFTKDQIALVDDATEAIQRRDHEIQEISRSISDLANIFQDLQTMVIDQGTLLDRIDYHIEQVHTSTRGAVEELDKAEHYQKRTRKTKLILLLILIIIGLIIIIIFKPRRGAVEEPPATPAVPATPELPIADRVLSLDIGPDVP
ncbi:t-SNARE [Thamnocephalis sphaerospora]|uniref:t-SNARE n=1 Tax=Thamnocephalis sphaerospora TaxID=78915 RepID=A0A4V1IVP0_9FUNG|nr:t-SNARE [Thamnocephalis sphaerospora]|eukprot:RKP04729.1 t-SNARE [Thamnocephalis sphaerospora]